MLFNIKYMITESDEIKIILNSFIMFFLSFSKNKYAIINTNNNNIDALDCVYTINNKSIDKYISYIDFKYLLLTLLSCPIINKDILHKYIAKELG